MKTHGKDMKHLKYEHIDIDPFGEEDWDEKEFDGTFLNWLKINYPNEDQWDDIKSIDCSHNNLKSLDGIEKLRNLKVLYCWDNNLTSLKGIENLRNLWYLSCYNNDLTSLKGIENLRNLTLLYCDNNNLTSLDEIKDLRNLTWLNCSNNNLTSLKIDFIKNEKNRER